MSVKTPERTTELLLPRYKERNYQRLLEPDRLAAEVRGLADAWFILQAIGTEGLDINDLRGRFRFLKPLIAHRVSGGGDWLRNGLHVEYTDPPEFEYIRAIHGKLPDFAAPEVKNLPHYLGIDEEIAEFTTGAKF